MSRHQICHAHCPDEGGGLLWVVIIVVAAALLGAGDAVHHAARQIEHVLIDMAEVAGAAAFTLIAGFIAWHVLVGNRRRAAAREALSAPAAAPAPDVPPYQAAVLAPPQLLAIEASRPRWPMAGQMGTFDPEAGTAEVVINGTRYPVLRGRGGGA